MNEDVGASGASALATGHMSDRMSRRIAVVGGRRRWSVDQKLAISDEQLDISPVQWRVIRTVRPQV